MPDPAAKPYHHGDLRRALVETAAEMLREERGWQFTLREVARRAGVSHGAPYKHFPDKAALLAELALAGFDQLRLAMEAAATPRPSLLRDELLVTARAYIDFGVRNPSLYRLMFSTTATTSEDVHLADRALAAMGTVLELLARGQQTGALKRQPVPDQAAACWAQVHGLTMLSIDGLLLPEKVGDRPVDGALITLLEGLQA